VRTFQEQNGRCLDRGFRISHSWLFVLPSILLGAALDRGSVCATSRCTAAASAEIHYSPGEDLERIDVALLRAAERQIDMAAYVLTDRAVVEALREAAGRGVEVRVWRDANMAERVGDVDARPSSAGGSQASSFGQTRLAAS
jgi:phosphatidylserine/phosphatidylglycerophosphate/cardiolipin synthase-like enzyme